MSTSSSLPKLPSGLAVPNTPLIAAALKYSRKHTTATTVNHCLRAAYFAVLLSRKLPAKDSEAVDLELIVYSNIMHDLGWSQDHTFISKDKRFEVDSADLARKYLEDSHYSGDWDKHRVQLMWDAIALHATPSFAQHKESEVTLAHLGVMADFFGPAFPGGAITIEEYKEIVTAFPRLEFRDQFLQIMCGLCAYKPETTYDNFVSDFGVAFGVDGKGKGKEEFEKARRATTFPHTLWHSLLACKQYE
ncbi:hypothetical protein H2200_002205 [Cladophialophora chaetospira]|uniref:HD domain-containing protein n=1 Tax=Cladophialophora chaetospira TaxID=386627 RepID=A0AA38XIJ7_9EURO|nr:hypothetical protein H2200_002205 [Cladophialophora chaetospira]